jgi:radical SAM superfamily enzyme YgiQ (UPF0313 family)
LNVNREPNVILILPNVFHTRLGLISPWEVPPLGIAYIAAVLEQANLKVSIIDAFIDQLSLYDLGIKIEKINPNIIGITSNAYAAKYAMITAKYLKKKFPNKIVVMGGVFPTVTYEFLLQSKICDVCVIGEGEYTFKEFVENYDKPDVWDSIKGIAFLRKLDKRLILTPAREYIENLDELPFPSWHLFPKIEKYRKLRGITRTPYLPIITSRGCPYLCNWCNKTIHGYKYRSRSAENVVAEIKYFVDKFHIKEIAIMDDTFTLNEFRVKKICYLIKKKKLDVFINLYNGTRADTITDSLLKYLTSVGFNRLTIGVESGNQNILEQIGKQIKLEQIEKSIKLAKKYHLIVDGFFIIGHIFDTPKSIIQTIKFAVDNAFDHAYFFTAIPFKGSKLYNLVKNQGHFLADFEQGSDYHIVEGIPAFETHQLTADQIKKYYKLAYKQFYLRIHKIWDILILYLRLLIQYGSIDEIVWLFSQTFHLLKIQFKK